MDIYFLELVAMQDLVSDPVRTSNASPAAVDDGHAYLAASSGIVSVCNDQLATLFGYDRGDLIGIPLTALFPQVAPTSTGEILGRHRDGSALWVRATHHSATTPPDGYAKWRIEDVTERKLSELAATSSRTIVRRFEY